MKTKIATAISMFAVLGAGSAAAMVNTRILDSGASESGASAAVVPPASSVDVTVPAATVPATTLPTASAGVDDATTTTSTSDPSSTTSSTITPSPAPTGLLTAFNVGEAGVVTVDVVDHRLVLVSAVPQPGWSVSTSEERDDGVEVHFDSATERVEFEATLDDGRIVPTVESESLVPPARTPTPPPSPVAADVATTTVPRVGDDHGDDHGGDDDRDDHVDDHDDDHDDDHADDGGGSGGDDERDDD